MSRRWITLLGASQTPVGKLIVGIGGGAAAVFLGALVNTHWQTRQSRPDVRNSLHAESRQIQTCLNSARKGPIEKPKHIKRLPDDLAAAKAFFRDRLATELEWLEATSTNGYPSVATNRAAWQTAVAVRRVWALQKADFLGGIWDPCLFESRVKETYEANCRLGGYYTAVGLLALADALATNHEARANEIKQEILAIHRRIRLSHCKAATIDEHTLVQQMKRLEQYATEETKQMNAAGLLPLYMQKPW